MLQFYFDVVSEFSFQRGNNCADDGSENVRLFIGLDRAQRSLGGIFGALLPTSRHDHLAGRLLCSPGRAVKRRAQKPPHVEDQHATTGKLPG